VRRDENRLGIIANRVRRNTLIYQSLTRFLATLNIPIVATLRDSQSYVRSAETGYGLAEMKAALVAEDWADWQPMFEWLESPTYHRVQGASVSPAAQQRR
jgi:chromosome partitioning protein